MDIVIMCGGKSTRLSEKLDKTNKALVEIGNFPIIWHIMKLFDFYDYKKFHLALGDYGNEIKKWFLDYRLYNSLELDMEWPTLPSYRDNWKINLKNTGSNSGTAFRLKLLENDIKSDKFIFTYGDGLANININELIKFHNEQVKKYGVIATISAVRNPSQFGIIKDNKKGLIEMFEEKPKTDMWINMGFIVCEKEIFKYLTDDQNAMLVKSVFPKLAEEGKLAVYKHDGFFKPMDTFKDYQELNTLWETRNAPWNIWMKKEDSENKGRSLFW